MVVVVVVGWGGEFRASWCIRKVGMRCCSKGGGGREELIREVGRVRRKRCAIGVRLDLQHLSSMMQLWHKFV